MDECRGSKEWTALSMGVPSWNNWFHQKIRLKQEVMHKMEAYWSSELKVLKILFILGDYARGSPFHAHGGLTFTLMDSFGGWSSFLYTNKLCMTKSAEIRYKAPIFPFRLYCLETHLVSLEGRTCIIRVDIRDTNGKLCMDGTFDFRFRNTGRIWDDVKRSKL